MSAEYTKRLLSQDPARALAETLGPLLRAPPAPDKSHITDLAVSLVRELRRLRARLREGEGFTFAAVAPPGRMERAVTFFALLELHARGEARLSQRRHCGDIEVRPCPRPALAV